MLCPSINPGTASKGCWCLGMVRTQEKANGHGERTAVSCEGLAMGIWSQRRTLLHLGVGSLI